MQVVVVNDFYEKKKINEKRRRIVSSVMKCENDLALYEFSKFSG